MSRAAVGRDTRLVEGGLALLAASVLAAGVIAFVHGRADRDVAPSASHARRASSGPATYGSRIPLPPAAMTTARDFLSSAVLRADLARAWDLTAPALKTGFTKRQWRTGPIPVVPYPAKAFRGASFTVVRSRERDILLLVNITAKDSATVGSQAFFLELVPAEKRWLVSYWAPRGFSAPLPAVP